jgi:hypothetical protein
VHKGWLPSYRFRSGLLMDWASASAARLERRLNVEATASLLNDLARERLLAHYHDHTNVLKWLGTVVTPLERALERFPTALVPRFNLVRILLHFGEPRDVRRGLNLIDETLGCAQNWQLDPLDDVLPWDFCPAWFNYRRYFDAVTAGLGSADGSVSELVAVILASLNHYRARYADEIPAKRTKFELAAEAVRLDPDFPEYALYHCRLLMARGDEAAFNEASARLQQLLFRSARFLEVLDIARHLPSSLRGGWYNDLENSTARLWSALRVSEDLREPVLRSPIEAGLRVNGQPFTEAAREVL